jgi:hypothetical protein
LALKIKLIDVAQVIRSKNSGPYELTFDIIFKDWESFDEFCNAKVINKELIAKLYQIPAEKVINVIEFKPAKAIKATIERPIASGELGETDVYGAQQHAPLLNLEFEL